MSTSRKDRERQAREELILQHAQRLLMRDGFQDLNLDELARAIEYSKGTIYLHFASKEDLALAVATRALRGRADLFERALGFQGLSRERAQAIGFACCHFMVAHPDYFHIEMMLKSDSFWERASEAHQLEHNMQAGRTFRAVHRVVLGGLESGDLPKKPHTTSEQLAFALIAVTMGSHVMAQAKELRLLACIEDPIKIVRANQHLMLDGMGWKPLPTEFDYAATDQRIKAEIFPEAVWLT
ncbi:MAG: TetR/AcrR family transcriptional regulator [Roseimicrobium sp.]